MLQYLGVDGKTERTGRVCRTAIKTRRWIFKLGDEAIVS